MYTYLSTQYDWIFKHKWIKEGGQEAEREGGLDGKNKMFLLTCLYFLLIFWDFAFSTLMYLLHKENINILESGKRTTEKPVHEK